MKGIVARAKHEGREKTRLSLVKALLDEPTAAIKASIKAWTHKNLVGKSAVFIPPTEDEVFEYAKEVRRDEDLKGKNGGKNRAAYERAPDCVEDFYAHYHANGWVQGQKGGKPIGEWKLTFLKWCRSQMEGKFSGGGSTEPVRQSRKLGPHPSLVGVFPKTESKAVS